LSCPSILCLHGLGRSPADWSEVRTGLERHGTVRTPALPRDSERALEVARASVERNGRSIGATSLDYALHRVAFVRELSRRGSGGGLRGEGARALASLAGLALRPGGFDALLERVTVPVLIVHARDDHHVPVDFALAVAARRPDWGLRVLPDGGHNAHAEHPERWLAAVDPWLARRCE
jgi:pimeloyl-ACP methyl ester carboxylesterase